MAENFFRILGVAPASTDVEIQAAFRKLSRELHPDIGGDEVEYQIIVDAYNVLKDVKKRGDFIKFLELTQDRCSECRGLGVQWKQRGLRSGEFMKCSICKGGGYLERT